MGAYSKERLDNLVGLIASEFKAGRGKPLSQTYLWKFLALFEFKVLEKVGYPPLGLKYAAMPKGPVPIDLYEAAKDLAPICDTVNVLDGGSSPKGKIRNIEAQPDFEFSSEFFSDLEIDIIDELLDVFLNPKFVSDDASELSHESIRAWREAWEEATLNGLESSPMSFDATFPELETATEEHLSSAARRYAIGKLLG